MQDDDDLESAYLPKTQNYEPQKPAYEPSYSSYANYAPVPCPQNLLISCQPSVQQVPCSSYYSSDSYAPQSPSYPPPTYRENESDWEEDFVGAQQPEQK